MPRHTTRPLSPPDGFNPLLCRTCGTGFPPVENAMLPTDADYQHDLVRGFGICQRCGGEPKARMSLKQASADEKRYRRAMGLNYCQFIDSRIVALLGPKSPLSPAHQATLRAMPYAKQCHVITGLIERGHLV